MRVACHLGFPSWDGGEKEGKGGDGNVWLALADARLVESCRACCSFDSRDSASAVLRLPCWNSFWLAWDDLLLRVNVPERWLGSGFEGGKG